MNMERREITRQLFAGLAASGFAMCAGFHVGWSAPSLSKLLAADSEILMTSAGGSWIVSFYLVGVIFVSFMGAALVDKCGRKLCLLCTVIPYLSSCIFIAVAQDYWWFLVARFVAGCASGISMIILAMYLGEIADDKIRGALGTMVSVMVNVGILLPYCVGPWINRVALAGLGGALPLAFGLMTIWIPESPYFLIMKEKPDCAEKSLLWLRGTRSVSEELEKVKKTVEFDQQNAGTMKELITVPGNRKALIIVIGLAAAQQFSGISAILAYSSLILEASGSTIDSSISAIIFGVVQLLSGLSTIFTIDLIGRRPLLLFSVCGAILFLGGEALYFQLQAIGTDVSAISWLPVTAIVGYMISYPFGLGCVPYVVLSEIFPCNAKAFAIMIYTVVCSAAGIVVTKLYQVFTDAFGIHVSFWGFAVVTIISGIFIYFILPETKQRSFRSIQDELHQTTESTANLEKFGTP